MKKTTVDLHITVSEVVAGKFIAHSNLAGFTIRSKATTSSYLAVVSLFSQFIEEGSDSQLSLQMALVGTSISDVLTDDVADRIELESPE